MWVCVGCGVVEVAVLWDGVCVSTKTEYCISGC